MRALLAALPVALLAAVAPVGAVSPGPPPQPPAAAVVVGAASVVGVAAKTRVPANGASYAIPAGTTWLALVQTGATPAQVLALPASPLDGQILFLSTAGAIRSLAFVPSFPGWANGSALPGNSGLTLGWDAGSNLWTRIQ